MVAGKLAEDVDGDVLQGTGWREGLQLGVVFPQFNAGLRAVGARLHCGVGIYLHYGPVEPLPQRIEQLPAARMAEGGGVLRQVQKPSLEGCWYHDVLYTVEVGFPTDQTFPIHEESRLSQFSKLPLLKTESHLLAKRV